MLEIVGMEELLDKLDKMGSASKKVGNTALKKAAKGVRKEEVSVVKSTHNKYSENVGWKELKTYSVKTKKSGSKYIDTGLRAKGGTKKDSNGSRSSQWERAKGLWYNNFGFYHNRTGMYVAGTNWLSKAYDNSVDEAYLTIYNTLLKEMGFR